MKNIFKVLILNFCFGISVFSIKAQENNKIKELEDRINILEKRHANLEKMFYQNLAHQKNNDSLVTKQKVKAMARVKKDKDKFPAEELKNAEELYVKGTDKMKTDKGKKILEKLVSKYSQTNRAGCAALYLAQNEKGPQQEELLKHVMAKYNGCFYLDGVQVGPYARFYLAKFYNEKGDKKLFDEQIIFLKENYPDAIDHQGKKLSDYVW